MGLVCVERFPYLGYILNESIMMGESYEVLCSGNKKNMLLVKSASNFVPEFQTQITSAQNQYNAVNIDCKYPLTKAMNAYFWNVYRRYTINTSSCSKMIPCKWGKDKPCSGRTCSCTKAKLSCSKFYNCQKTMFFCLKCYSR